MIGSLYSGISGLKANASTMSVIGDNIANVAMLFGSNGYCQDRFVAVEYNSLGEDPLAQLDALIAANKDFDLLFSGGSVQVVPGYAPGLSPKSGTQ